MRVVLEVVSGPLAAKKITLDGHQKASFGRTNWADFQFPADTLMSGKHFSVECEGQKCLVRDLNSTNGTYLDEERIIEAAAASGATIRAGHTKFRVTLEDVEAPAPERQTWTHGLADSSLVVTAHEEPFLFLPSQLGETDSTRPYDEALNDADPIVRRNALYAAIWSGRAWALEYCRRVSDPPLSQHWEMLLLLGILGQPSDLERILTIGRTVELGPRRYQVLGAFGHPLVVKDLLIGMESKNPAVAVAAAEAFTQITGVDVSSDVRVALPSEGDSPDEFEAEFLDEAALPNPEMANREWKKLKPRFQQGLRWRRGIEVSQGLPEGALETLDLESRWQACLRGRFSGTWKASRFDLEQLADKLSSE